MGRSKAPALRPRYLKGKAREEALREPGPSWREWTYSTLFKAYLGLALLILDGFALVTLEESNIVWLQWATVPAIPLVLFANYLLYAFLWASPPEEGPTRRHFRPSLRHPFYVGRWHPDRKDALGRIRKPEGEEVPPDEFV